jgi:hypothetical protein
MAYTKAMLSNGVEVKTAPIGFSWTTLLFGFWPAVFRFDWLWAAILFVACLLTYGIAGIIFAFFYNKIYVCRLLDKGYTFTSLGGLTEEAMKAYTGRVSIPVKTV